MDSRPPLPARDRLALALALALLVPACADETITGPSVLTGTVWRLRAAKAADSGTTTNVDPDRYTVQFSDGGQVSIRADCNMCSGGYVGRKRSLTIGTLACTRAFCGSASLGDKYVGILAGAELYEVTGQTLTLVSPGGILLYQP
jgi:heat shock protein HslJ